MKLCGQVDSWTFKKRCDIAPGLGRFLFFQRLLVRSNLYTIELMCLMIFSSFIEWCIHHHNPAGECFHPPKKDHLCLSVVNPCTSPITLQALL